MLSVQKLFSSLDLLSSDNKIADTDYQWMINARQRFGVVEPIKKHKDLTQSLPAGVKQGIYAIGNVLLAFVSGKAYLQQDGQTSWAQVANFQMSADAVQYWTQSVPASSFNFVRKAATNIQSPITVTTDFKVSGTPSCIVVQDGVSQPWLIIYDTINQVYTSRAAKTFSDWSNTSGNLNDREYVPIGKQMMYMNQTLFIVSPDGKSVYRSITGRPLDFMINVDTDGNKATSEALGGAATVSFAMDFDFITCIQPVNIQDSFVYGTARNTRLVTADYTNTIFGEPTFKSSPPLTVGIVNQYSFVDILGDYACIDFDGVKSFNAVQNQKFRGRNSIFSLMISKLVKLNANKKIKQRNPICINFNDYCLFNLDTRYGNLLAVYDTLSSNWVSFDITELSQIKQFAIVETLTESKLYAITYLDELFQVFGDEDNTEVAMVKTRAYTSAEPASDDPRYPLYETSVEHKSDNMHLFFDAGTVEGNVTLIEYVDEQEKIENRETQALKLPNNGVFYPVRPPVKPNSDQQVNHVTFSLTTGLLGKKISYIIIWDNDANLNEFQVKTSKQNLQVSSQQQQQILQPVYNPAGN